MPDAATSREPPERLRCPRCRTLLEPRFGAVLACADCKGTWLPEAAIERLFGDRAWPRGTDGLNEQLWWRNTLACPACASIGADRIMTVLRAGDVVFDRCELHGMWLDRTKVFQLLGSGVHVEDGEPLDEAALRARLGAGLPAPRPDPTEPAPAAPAPVRAKREQLEEARVEAAGRVDRLDQRTAALREQLRTAEAELRRTEAEFDDERAGLRVIEEQLAALRSKRP